MKGFLLNENLPARLAKVLIDGGLSAVHVSELGLNGRPDWEVWARALADNLAVMTKDSDYIDLVLAGGEGKVVLIATGNLRLNALILHVGARMDAIREFLDSTERVVSI